MHWALYLRTDIQDLSQDVRQDLREIRQEARDFKAEVKTDFAAVHDEFAVVRSETKAEFAAVRSEIGEFRTESRGEFVTVRTEFSSVRTEMAQIRIHADNRFHWLVGIMVTLFGLQVTGSIFRKVCSHTRASSSHSMLLCIRRMTSLYASSEA
jgi:hypothetical protein